MMYTVGQALGCPVGVVFKGELTKTCGPRMCHRVIQSFEKQCYKKRFELFNIAMEH